MEIQHDIHENKKLGLTITQDEFLASASKFKEKSDKLYDSWEIIEFQGVKYLKLLNQRIIPCKLIHSENDHKDITSVTTVQCKNSNEEISYETEMVNISLEYNIIYSVSYCVPVLYLRGFDSFGRVLRLDELIKQGLFSKSPQNINKLDGKEIKIELKDQDENSSSIHANFVRSDTFSQVSHPLNFQPFYQLHPCHTSEWMKMMCSVHEENKGTEMSLSVENYIIIWLSFVGPFIGLSIDNKYILS